jgi:hypothetical protein
MVLALAQCTAYAHSTLWVVEYWHSALRACVAACVAPRATHHARTMHSIKSMGVDRAREQG